MRCVAENCGSILEKSYCEAYNGNDFSVGPCYWKDLPNNTGVCTNYLEEYGYQPQAPYTDEGAPEQLITEYRKHSACNKNSNSSWYQYCYKVCHWDTVSWWYQN